MLKLRSIIIVNNKSTLTRYVNRGAPQGFLSDMAIKKCG